MLFYVRRTFTKVEEQNVARTHFVMINFSNNFINQVTAIIFCCKSDCFNINNKLKMLVDGIKTGNGEMH